MTDAELHAKFLEWRGIEYPCETCQGSGKKTYSSTATWAGGIGGQAFTVDVCDKCWGSGDMYRTGTDLKAMQAKLRDHRVDNIARARRVETPCHKCQALGGKWYSSGSTWRGGMGTCMCEWDVCDYCWGSGDEHKHWTNIRALEATEKERIQEATEKYWFNKTGSYLFSKAVFDDIVTLLEKETRRHKVGEHYVAVCTLLAKALKEMGRD
jgi:hypothetical protein